MSAKMNCAIIGCGVIAPTHAAAFNKQENVSIKYACDLIETKAKALAEKFDIQETCTDYTQALNDPEVDCISICTDHGSHAEIAIAALEAGKHVLCEKALASSQEGLDAMVAAHEKCPELVFAGIFQHRFETVNRYLKQLVDEGAFGTILIAGVQHRCLRKIEYYEGDEWRGTWAQEGGSVLVNQAIHFVDVLTWIMGGVDSLTGTHANFTHGDSIETEDTAIANLRFKNGALGTIEATCSSHLGWDNRISIHGSTGSVDIWDNKPVKVEFEDPQMAEKVKADLLAGKDDPTNENTKVYYGSGHEGQIADFVQAIREKREPFVTAESACHAVEIALAIYKSHSTGGWVKV